MLDEKWKTTLFPWVIRKDEMSEISHNYETKLTALEIVVIILWSGRTLPTEDGIRPLHSLMWTQINNLPCFVWQPFTSRSSGWQWWWKGLAIAACSILPDVRIPAPQKGVISVGQMLGGKDVLPGQLGGCRSSSLGEWWPGADQRSVGSPHLIIFSCQSLVWRAAGCSSYSKSLVGWWESFGAGWQVVSAATEETGIKGSCPKNGK